MALVAVEALADGLQTALDVGCGSGVLAIAAARLGLRVHGIDIQPSALRDARTNAQRNGVDATFSSGPVSTLTGRYDLVLANLHAELIVSMADHLVERTGTWLVLAGILADREQPVHAALDGRLALVDRVTDGEWVSLWLRRPE